MKSNPSVINISSDSSDSSESLTSPPPFQVPIKPRRLTKEQAKKKKHDVGASSRGPNPSRSSESSEDSNPWIPYQPPPREIVSPFICTSSDEDEDEDLYNPLSTPERPQSSRLRPPSRPRRSNPPLPRAREVVIGLPCPQQSETFNRNKGKNKIAEVIGKGKGKVE